MGFFQNTYTDPYGYLKSIVHAPADLNTEVVLDKENNVIHFTISSKFGMFKRPIHLRLGSLINVISNDLKMDLYDIDYIEYRTMHDLGQKNNELFLDIHVTINSKTSKSKMFALGNYVEGIKIRI